MIRLGVNVDHIATLRQARGTRYPDPVQAALLAQDAGADGITLHLREDRRHIQDRDVELLTNLLQVPMNLEMAITDEMLEIAIRQRPEHCCLVPEHREELTTEGGLDVIGQRNRVADACQRLAEAGVRVSIFIDPDREQIAAAKACGAPCIELHTGRYADAVNPAAEQQELAQIVTAAAFAADQGLEVHAGHGLHYHNVQAVAAIPQLTELNIGHGLVARAVFSGLADATREMKRLMVEARMESQA